MSQVLVKHPSIHSINSRHHHNHSSPPSIRCIFSKEPQMLFWVVHQKLMLNGPNMENQFIFLDCTTFHTSSGSIPFEDLPRLSHQILTNVRDEANHKDFLKTYPGNNRLRFCTDMSKQTPWNLIILISSCLKERIL